MGPKTNDQMNSAALMAAQAGAQIGGGLLGMATANWQDKRQVKQAKKLQELQLAGQKEMGEYNRQQAMQMWKDTNYPEQIRQLKAAGLNPGLMYGMGGGGGTTAQTQPGNVSGSQAQGSSGEPIKGMELGLAGAMQAAQMQLIQAQAKKTNIEANKLAGVDTGKVIAETGEIGARTENIKQLTTNAKVQQNILNWEERLKAIQTNIGQSTQEDIIQKVAFEATKLNGEAKSAMTAGAISQETYDQIVQQVNQTTTEQQLRMGAIKAGIVKTQQETENLKMGISKMAVEIRNMHTERMQSWDKLNLQEREVIVKEMMQKIGAEQMEFNTSDAAKVKQWTSVVTDIISGVKTAIPMMN